MLNPRIISTIGKAERAVIRLIDRCQKDGPLYANSPKTTAQVSRTGKWLLNAIKALTTALESQNTTANPPSC